MISLWKMTDFMRFLTLSVFFSEKELIRFWKKSRYDRKLLKSPEFMHEVTEQICKHSTFAEKIQSHLDSKYLDEHIESSLQKSIWSLLRISDNIENLSNLSKIIASVINNEKVLHQRIQSLTRDNDRLKEDVKTKRSIIRDLKKKPDHVKSSKVISENNSDASIDEMNRQIDSLLAEIQNLKDENGNLRYTLDSRNNSYEELKGKYEELKISTFTCKTDAPVFLNTECPLQTTSRQADRCLDCTDGSLCQKRVLLVGGLDRCQHLYKDVIESQGAEFRHHNGTKISNKSKLTDMVHWADIVFCPVNINSHNACLKVKSICQKNNKDYYMMPSASISSLKKTLSQI